MRILAATGALALLLAACGERAPAGCRTVACVCDDGSSGTRACGADTCVCTPGVCVLGHPGALDFGAVPPGETAGGTAILVNEGDGPCAVSSVRLDGCGPAFDLPVAFAATTVPPGEPLSIPVAFRPDVGPDPGVCTLDFDANDASPHHRISLHGDVDLSCLAVAPPSLAFDVPVAGCGTAAGTATVSNGCVVPLLLLGVSLDGPAFFPVGEPVLPATVAPGADVPLGIGFGTPIAGNHAGSLVLAFAGGVARTVPLAGTAGEGAWAAEHVVGYVPRPRVDVLLVLDNGTSMADEAANVAANLERLPAYLHAEYLDFHLGVTTTGLAPGGDCPGGADGGEDGRLFPVDGSSARILAPETPEVEAAWEANLRVGACREGPNQVFEAALRALSPPIADAADDPRHPEPDDGNRGFLRPDARLVVMAVTDREDASPGTVDFYRDALAARAGSGGFLFHAVVGDRATGCRRAGTGSAEPGDRLIALVERADGGIFGSICAPDFGDMWFGSAAGGYPDIVACYPLAGSPADLNADGRLVDTDGELEVSVNGVVWPSTAAQGQRIWWADADDGRVCFHPLATPEPGSSIDLRYRLPCETP
jgi:hypothetical protein